MLLKVKNLGNSFRTITGENLPTGATTWVQPWEAFMWLKDETKHIQIIDEPLEDAITITQEEPVAEEKPSTKTKRKKK